jgi:FkbM family methyltransferase
MCPSDPLATPSERRRFALLRSLLFARWIPAGVRRRVARRAARWVAVEHGATDPLAFSGRLAGHVYEGTLRSHLDAAVYFHGGFEKPLACFLQDAARALRAEGRFSPANGGLHFWDVGANVGQHSLVVAAHVDTVEAFEPFDEVADQFEAHVARNGLQDIRLHRIALGERREWRSLITPTTGNRGTAALVEDARSPAPGTPGLEVEVRSGDEVAAELMALGRRGMAGLVKIDVEGWERQVLAGLRGTLQAARPVVVTEVSYSGPHAFRSQHEFMEAFPPDYRLFRFDTRKADGSKARRQQARERRTGAYRLRPFTDWLTGSQDDLVACPLELVDRLPRAGSGLGE